MMKLVLVLSGLLAFYAISPAPLRAESTAVEQLQTLSERMSQLESRESELATRSAEGSVAVFLFGAFCALWAQNSNRNAWLWFFMGLFFNVVTVIVLLVKNSNDRQTSA